MSEAGSGIEGFKSDSAFARFVTGALQAPFRLADVGCAGGLAPGWRAFGDRLSALGFDPDPAAIAALVEREINPAVRYVQGFVGLPAEHPLAVRLRGRAHQHGWVGGRLAYERVRWMKARQAAGLPPLSLEDYLREVVEPQASGAVPFDGYDLDYTAAFEPPAPEVAPSQAPATDLIHLPTCLSEAGFDEVDFIKIDVDGPDFEILRSCAGVLARPSLLGVAIEVSFFGSHDANDNTFHNVDRLMRSHGFDLFGLSVRGYASAALPSPFMDRHASANYQGRPFQGDAVYIRDLASPAQRPLADGLSVDKLLKAAALFALFNLQDQAAEILIAHRERLSGAIDVDAGLDLLTAEVPDSPVEGASYRDWIALFEQEDPRLYDVYSRRAQWMSGLMQAARDAPAKDAGLAEAAARLEDAEVERRRAEDALKAAETRIADLESELRTTRRSRLWRAGESLRGLGGRLGGGGQTD